MMIYVLLHLYTSFGSKVHQIICKPCTESKPYSDKYLLPFNDDELENCKQGTPLKGRQALYFYFFYLLNFIVWISLVLMFSFIMYQGIQELNTFYKYILDEIRGRLNQIGLIFHLLSQFGAIQSCFIFSKIAYSLFNNISSNIMKEFKKIDDMDPKTLRKENLTAEVQEKVENTAAHAAGDDSREVIVEVHTVSDSIDTARDDEPQVKSKVHDQIGAEFKGKTSDHESPVTPEVHQTRDVFEEEKLQQRRIDHMKMIDQWHIGQANASIKPYGYWFAAHWLLYTITAFMTIALFAEIVANNIYSPEPWLGNRRKLEGTAYIFLFMLEHIILFLYPCFRAAQITKARVSLIKKVSRHSWKHLSL